MPVEHWTTGPVIAIDGPAGSGKSTLAMGLARSLGIPYVNTGLMYRALASTAADGEADPDDGPGLARRAEALTFDLDLTSSVPQLLIDGETPSQRLSEPRVERVVSQVARHPEVRAVMRSEQRRLGAGGGVVEGRDIGTVVFPEAPVKIFLAASAGERVARRASERGGVDRAGELVRRDSLDARVNPFVPAADAELLETTDLSADEVLARALRIVESRLGSR
jgi:cytidylate kinase